MAILKSHHPFAALLILTYFLNINNVFSQDTIKWSPTYNLNWEDFQGTPDTSVESAAITSSGISCKTLFTDTSFTINVFAFFEKRKSWKSKSVNKDILSHEQGHFDIAEIFARKLKIELKNIAPIRASIQSDVNFIVKKINLAKELMQDRYDEETDFGRNFKTQQDWTNFIDAELSKLPAAL